jgi:phytoene desaturase
MKDIVIIGSGIAGLAAACRLRTTGFKVLVIEANSYPGGKLTEIRKQGYRFDAGPSLFTMPQFLDDVFTNAGRNPRDYYNFEKLDISCEYFYDDSTRITAYADVNRFAKEIETKLTVAGDSVIEYLQKAEHIYSSAAHIFLENSLQKAKTWLSRSVVKAIPQIPKLGLFETMHKRNERLLHEKHLVQLFDRYATYNGSDPYQAPGILTSIPHLEFNVGTFFPQGGMHSITQALYKLAVDLGVEFKFNTRALEIITTGNRVTGVKTQTDHVPADVVVSNMDVYPTYQKLLPNAKTPAKILSQERSSSALIFYWGIKQEFTELDLHNIFFAKEYKQEFEALFKTHTLYHDPTVYINITSKFCKTDAPVNSENWFVMINVPANVGQDWDNLIEKARKSIIEKLNRLLGIHLESLIETEEILDPRSIETRTSSYQGSLYGTSSNNKFAAFLRHPNFSKTYQNLFFCGGSAHPGGGIPLCLQSGRITSNLIIEQFGKKSVF